MCEALAFAHEEGIIHRDIKPSNIMIDKRGRVKVADFGLAKTVNLEHSLQTQSNMAMGTPDFIAPEALMPGMKVDQRADIYAVGVMLYQMLTGHIPRGRFELPSGVVPRVDKGLDAVVDRAMQTDREKRYSTALEMKVEVESVLARSGGFQPPSPPAPAVENRRSLTKSRTPLLLGAAAAMILLGVGAWFLMDEPKVAGIDAVSASPSPQDSKSSAPTWRKAITRFEDVPAAERAKGTLRWQDGWLESTSNTQSPPFIILPGPKVRNGGIRVRGRMSPDIPFPTLGSVFLRRTPGADATNQVYRVSAIAAQTSTVGLTLANDKTKAQEELARLTLPRPLNPGDEFALELIAIGDQLYVRLNDQRLPVVTDTRLKEGSLGLHCVHPMRDVEMINLDGLSEPEARKAAGINPVSTSPSPQVSKSSTAAFPPGQWVKVLTKPEDLPEKMRASAQLQWQDGWISPSTANSPGVNIPSFYGKNRGIRLHGRKTADPSYLICSIWVRKENEPGAPNDAYRLTLSGTPTNVSLDFWNDTSKKQESFHTLRPDPPLVAGAEYDLELYAIGDQLIARYNGKLLPIATDKRLTEGEAGLQIKHEARDVEVINLDGLSEAEALKAATHH